MASLLLFVLTIKAVISHRQVTNLSGGRAAELFIGIYCNKKACQ
uniref:Uncharacterized protein n=1 Tax=Rheinheimera sp. BAL341 TaxID=1708203 RepID=A0A486XIM8_9GAMM